MVQFTPPTLGHYDSSARFKPLTLLSLTMPLDNISLEDFKIYARSVEVTRTHPENLRRGFLTGIGGWGIDYEKTVRAFGEYKSAVDNLKRFKGIDPLIDTQISAAERAYGIVAGVICYVTKLRELEPSISPVPASVISQLIDIEPKLSDFNPPEDKDLLSVYFDKFPLG